MAEFREIVREFHRLCETQRRLHKNTCDKCPIKIATLGTIFQCYRYVLENPKEAENIIMSWAAENPKPVYPTWGEWLEKQGVVKKVHSPRFEENGASYYKPMYEITNPIPADIAQKLGLQPREG